MPWEQARRCFRNELKLIDKDLVQLCGLLGEANLLDSEKRSKLLGRTQVIAEKLCQQRNGSRKYRDRVEQRLCEIQGLVEGVAHPEEHVLEFSRWQRNRGVRLIIEYLLQKNCHRTALTFSEQHGLQARTKHDHLIR